MGYLGAILGPVRGPLGAILGHLVVTMHSRKKNIICPLVFNDFKVTFEPSWGHVGSILAHREAILGHFGAILGAQMARDTPNLAS